MGELGAKSSDQGIVASLPDNVLFDFGSVALRGPSREKLALVAGLAQRSPGARVDISGFTDAVGSDEFNQRLSEARAGVVREALAILGVGRDRMSARGYGEARPVAPNTKPDGSDNPTGRAQNRRVEILLAGAHV
jgi:photosystem I P700 chlorophyll a apoprotein A2